MTNHPNRNWRSRMRQACELWLLQWIHEHGPPVDEAGRQEELRQAYAAGFDAGRKPPDRKPEGIP
jgi:hypothetical protein